MPLKSLPPRVGTLNRPRVTLPPKEVDPFYRKPEYESWRAEVIQRAGGACQHPGCGRRGVRLFADHIHEVRDGGAPFDPMNGQALCSRHHTLKTAHERAKRHGLR
jgi:5-methylcytosine-specific restriction protein A